MEVAKLSSSIIKVALKPQRNAERDHRLKQSEEDKVDGDDDDDDDDDGKDHKRSGHRRFVRCKRRNINHR